MIIPDANLLLYAYDEASPFHPRAKQWWSASLAGAEPVGLVAVVLFAFIRIGTSGKVFENPLTITEAAGHVRSWLQTPMAELLSVSRSDVEQALEWLSEAGVGGNLTTDAQIAAVAKRCRAEVHSADTDFMRFRGVRWKNPLL
ncbi:MAG: PIN domain-containing protein [Verrucomicrobia bacterium]|nr:PIN domain-containing protein [Verrucomicrobiota bacterium]